MFPTKYAAITLVAVIAFPLACATDPEGDTSGSAGMNGENIAPIGGAMSAQSTGGTGATSGGVGGTSGGGMGGGGMGGGQTATPDGGPTPTPTGDEIDATGVWWTEVATVGSETLPWLDKLPGTDIRFVMRVEVSGTAPNQTVTFDFCDLQTEWIDPADPNNITTIGFRPDTVAAFGESITADFGGLSPGDAVPLPSLTFLGGLDESGQVFDDDGDGNPAVTAWVQTLLGIQIEVYETITISASLDLTATDDDTLQGTVDFKADALIVSSNNVIIFPDTVVTITPDSTAVPLTVKRLPGGGECSAIPSTIKFTTVPPAPPPLFPADPAMTP